jgi:hypothetical protein
MSVKQLSPRMDDLGSLALGIVFESLGEGRRFEGVEIRGGRGEVRETLARFVNSIYVSGGHSLRVVEGRKPFYENQNLMQVNLEDYVGPENFREFNRY